MSDMTGAMDGNRAEARILRFLAQAPASLEAASTPGAALLRNGCAAIAVEARLLRALARAGRIVVKDERVALAVSLVGRTATGGDHFLRQHGDLQQHHLDAGDGVTEVTVNLAESPLAQLARYKLRNGAPFVAIDEVEAGERLRADYTRGRLVPRLGANWEAAVAPGRRGSRGGAADLTDAALAARQRVDRALASVGPELAGVLVDVCCFLKGLEQVERERGWPVRSAKVVLKTALGALCRHYRPPSNRRQDAYPLHWGSDDYRPELR